jgi:DNA-binding FadR family transcriptional regulator
MGKKGSNMNFSSDDRALQVLSMIRDSPEPLGSWSLVDMFEEKGVNLSPATIGRILNHLEKQGYLEKKSYKGRVITGKGQQAMQRALKSRQFDKFTKKLENLLDSRVLHHFIMVLEARKAIEKEMARLAAKNITEEQIQKMEEMEHQREEDFAQHRIYAMPDIRFHHILAEASGNDVLVVFGQLISLLGQQSYIFDYMRSKLKKPYFISHKKIIAALKEHDPDKAEQCIIEHVDQLIHDVNNYYTEEKKSK